MVIETFPDYNHFAMIARGTGRRESLRGCVTCRPLAAVRAGDTQMRTWIDIENAPQVQYLSPFKRALEARGYEVVVTARDQGITLDLLRARGIEARVVGAESGKSKAEKTTNLGRRVVSLARLFRGGRRPGLLIAASRSSDLAARLLRIPNFQFTDYEYADDRISRLTGAYLLFPDVIGRQVFLDKGLRPDRLMPFPGLKEAISFSEIDLPAIQPYEIPGINKHGLVKVLFRPPGENTHYFVGESLELAKALLAELAVRDDILVVYSPRYPEQVRYLEAFKWANDPHVLHQGVPFVSLLKAVDLVISSGGTMLREAAFLGVPAFSILRSEIGQVDRYLESTGRLTILESTETIPSFHARIGDLDSLPGLRDVVDLVVDSIVERALAP